MNLPDLINGTFEASGGIAELLNVVRLMRDKRVTGISIWAMIFFNSWGFWNLYYYPHLGQWFSFTGGTLITLGNTLWVGLAIYYSRRNRGVRSQTE